MALSFHDVSNYQGNYTPTGPTIAKATEGTDFTDWTFASNRTRTLAGGWPFLGYHFLRHGSIAAQVAHAVSVVGSGQPLMLDVETAGDGSFPTLAEVEEFMDLYAQQSGGGRVTLTYIPEWFWSGHWGSPSLSPVAQRGAGLISSDYVPYSDTGPGWGGYGGMAPIIWQYTSTPLDTNAFKGTQDQLAAVFTTGGAMTAPADPLDPELDDMAWRMDALNAMSPVIRGGRLKGQPVAEVVALNNLASSLAAMTAGFADLKAAVAALGGPTSSVTVPTAAQIAAEVLDEEAARLAQ